MDTRHRRWSARGDEVPQSRARSARAPLSDGGRPLDNSSVQAEVAQADRKHAEFLSELHGTPANPKSALTRDEKGTPEWTRRENRVADNLRRHVQLVRAEYLPRDNKAALLLRRKEYKPPQSAF